MTKIMMEPIVREDGTILLEDLPVRPGQRVQIEVSVPDANDIVDSPEMPKPGTIAWILASDAIGMWADRDDIPDSPEYARILRSQVQQGSE